MEYDLEPYWRNYIDGAYCDGGAGKIDVIDPSTGEKLAEHALADAADVDRAVRAARRVYHSGDLADLSPLERGNMVRGIGRYLLDHLEEIKQVLTLEHGKPLFEADVEVRTAARLFEYFGSQAESLEGRTVPFDKNYFDFTINKPFGVSAQIIPCHYPVYIAARSLAAGLTTGNACVLKTAELTPISTVWFSRAVEAVGLPPGAVNILCGRGQEAGVALSTHPLINQIVFSGNVETGASVAAAAARNIVPSVLEVGGSSPTIVYEDADLEAFQFQARMGTYWNAGQFCTGMYRIIVHQDRYDDLVECAKELAESLTVGPGIEGKEFSLYMGPMDSERQLDKVEQLVVDAEKAGATLVTGGRRLNVQGSFMQPTVLGDVDSKMRVAQEEIFGPVMAVIPFREEEEAFRIANDTPFSGLLCAIFTHDIGRMTRAAHAVRAGHISVNASIIGGAEVPFGGGFGKSGYGRVKGREALGSYVQTKNILLPIG